MAVTVTKIAEESNPNNLTTYPDSSATQPAANRALLWGIWVHSTADPGNPTTLNAYGLTWTQVGTVLVGTTARLLVYEAYSGSSPTSTTVSLTMGVACSGCSFSIHELDGVDMTDFTVQVVTNSGTGTTATVTFGTLGDGTNNAEVMFTGTLVNAAITPDATATWTELADLGHNSPTARHHAQWRTGTDLTATSTWTGSAGWGAVGVEVKMASTAPTGSGGAATVIEVDTATAGTPAGRGGKATAIEVDTASTGRPHVSDAVASVIQVDTAADGFSAPTGEGGVATVITVDTAASGRPAGTGAVATALEVDTATEGRPAWAFGRATAIEVDTAGNGRAAVSDGRALSFGVDTAAAGRAHVADGRATILEVDLAAGGFGLDIGPTGGRHTLIEVDLAAAGRAAVRTGRATIIAVEVVADGIGDPFAGVQVRYIAGMALVPDTTTVAIQEE